MSEQPVPLFAVSVTLRPVTPLHRVIPEATAWDLVGIARVWADEDAPFPFDPFDAHTIPEARRPSLRVEWQATRAGLLYRLEPQGWTAP